MKMDTIGWVSALALGLVLAGCSSESSDWKSAAAADTGEAYQQYLQQHPNGANAAQAKTHLAQLQEDHDWQGASTADNRAAYEQFLTAHPDGKWAQEARIRIENFAQGGNAAVPAANGSAPPGAPLPAVHAPSATSAPTSRVAVAANHKGHTSAATQAHLVQLGAFSTQARAESHWKVLQARFPAQFKSIEPRYVAGKAKTNHLVRLQVSVSSTERARGLCATLHKHSQACVPVTA